MSNETKESMLNLVFFKAEVVSRLYYRVLKRKTCLGPLFIQLQYRAYSDFSLTR